MVAWDAFRQPLWSRATRAAFCESARIAASFGRWSAFKRLLLVPLCDLAARFFRAPLGTTFRFRAANKSQYAAFRAQSTEHVPGVRAAPRSVHRAAFRARTESTRTESTYAYREYAAFSASQKLSF